jgi:TatD DNase family protein
MPEWIDAHTHLDAEELYPEKEKILSRAAAAGVKTLLLVNSEATRDSFQRTLECASLRSESKLFVSFGIHPHHASFYSEELERILLEQLQHPSVIALGEIGLDYFYNHSPKELQISALRRQLSLSLERQLPIVIHCRDAYSDLAGILRAESKIWSGMIHCFTGTREEAEALLELGFYISFSGILTFRNAAILQDAARFVAMDRLLIETDAPYLAPVPMRGKTNEPSFVVFTGEFLAALKEVPAEDLSQQVRSNFGKLFPSTCAGSS